ncbi:hypothetical protein AA0119_g13302 [Alternaria tenuissima]|uniref:Thioredoxin domain-containing protein n=1 Tax=Alternaria tenuissima TaxID=119927 RepID=A0ABY0FP04_9PLEO|nr:hypothetical protein AA0119_g13302 [Alternaria tenuissima]
MSDNKAIQTLQNTKEFNEVIKVKGSLIIFDCFSTWCGPCKVIDPQILKLSQAYSDTFFYKLNVDEVPDVAQKLDIRFVPTFLLFKDGEKVAEVVGAKPKALEDAIRANLGCGATHSSNEQ